MKTTPQRRSSTDFEVTVVDTVSFVATNAREIVFEVKAVGAGKHVPDKFKKDEGPVWVTRIQWMPLNPSGGDNERETLEIAAENGHLSVSTVFHNRWLWLGFQLLTVACVLLSGKITLAL